MDQVRSLLSWRGKGKKKGKTSGYQRKGGKERGFDSPKEPNSKEKSTNTRHTPPPRGRRKKSFQAFMKKGREGGRLGLFTPRENRGSESLFQVLERKGFYRPTKKRIIPLMAGQGSKKKGKKKGGGREDPC